MSPEQIKKEDIELLQLKNHIIGMTKDYNWRMDCLRKARGKKFPYQSEERGLQVFNVNLDKALCNGS